MFMPLLLFSSFIQLSKAASGYDPVANPEAVVASGRARFTVLTPRMIRIQYSSREQFEDRATFAVVNRNLPVPAFTTREENGFLSNWYRCKFVIDDFEYLHVEQYMMAQKAKLFHDSARYTAILRATWSFCHWIDLSFSPYFFSRSALDMPWMKASSAICFLLPSGM